MWGALQAVAQGSEASIFPGAPWGNARLLSVGRCCHAPPLTRAGVCREPWAENLL